MAGSLSIIIQKVLVKKTVGHVVHWLSQATEECWRAQSEGSLIF
jgi:hypothetical protein